MKNMNTILNKVKGIKKYKNKIISIILTVCIVLPLFPAQSIFANEINTECTHDAAKAERINTPDQYNRCFNCTTIWLVGENYYNGVTDRNTVKSPNEAKLSKQTIYVEVEEKDRIKGEVKQEQEVNNEPKQETEQVKEVDAKTYYNQLIEVENQKLNSKYSNQKDGWYSNNSEKKDCKHLHGIQELQQDEDKVDVPVYDLCGECDAVKVAYFQNFSKEHTHEYIDKMFSFKEYSHVKQCNLCGSIDESFICKDKETCEFCKNHIPQENNEEMNEENKEPEKPDQKPDGIEIDEDKIFDETDEEKVELYKMGPYKIVLVKYQNSIKASILDKDKVHTVIYELDTKNVYYNLIDKNKAQNTMYLLNAKNSKITLMNSDMEEKVLDTKDGNVQNPIAIVGTPVVVIGVAIIAILNFCKENALDMPLPDFSPDFGPIGQVIENIKSNIGEIAIAKDVAIDFADVRDNDLPEPYYRVESVYIGKNKRYFVNKSLGLDVKSASAHVIIYNIQHKKIKNNKAKKSDLVDKHSVYATTILNAQILANITSEFKNSYYSDFPHCYDKNTPREVIRADYENFWMGALKKGYMPHFHPNFENRPRQEGESLPHIFYIGNQGENLDRYEYSF